MGRGFAVFYVLSVSILLSACTVSFETISNQESSANFETRPMGAPNPGDPSYFWGFTPKTAEAAVRKAFQAILWRSPDSSGLRAYRDILLAQGLSGWRGTVRAIAESGEFWTRIEPNKTYDAILSRFYEQFLGPNRGVDPSGYGAYMPMLRNNQYAEVVEAIATSEEFFSKLYVFPNLNEATATEAVQRAYRGILWRSADSGGMANYKNLILQHRYMGWANTVRAMVLSEEFRQNVLAHRSHDQILDRMYEYILGPNRPVDSSGRAAFTPMMRDGRWVEVILHIALSDEFFEKIAAYRPPTPTPAPTPRPTPRPAPTSAPIVTPTPTPTPAPVPVQETTPYELLFHRVGSGWFAKISPDANYVVYGFSETRVYEISARHERDYSGIIPGTYGHHWIRPGVVTMRKPLTDLTAERIELSVADWTPRTTGDNPSLVAGNFFAAADGNWISSLVSGQRITLNNNVFAMGFYGIALSRDQVIMSDPNGTQIHRRNTNGQTLAIHTAHVAPHQMSLSNGHIAYGGYGPIRGIYPDGRDVDLTVAPYRYEGSPQVVMVDGQPWLASTTWDEARKRGWAVIRPFEDMNSIVLNVPATHIDVAVHGEYFVVAVNNDIGNLYILRVRRDAPRYRIR